MEGQFSCRDLWAGLGVGGQYQATVGSARHRQAEMHVERHVERHTEMQTGKAGVAVSNRERTTASSALAQYPS